MFDHNDWIGYLSSGGEETVRLFQAGLSGTGSITFARKIRELHRAYCPCRPLGNAVHDALLTFADDAVDAARLAELGQMGAIDNPSMADRYRQIYQATRPDRDALQSDALLLAAFEEDLPYLSTVLAFVAPDVFIPYYFIRCFNVLTRIADTFGISLPPVPEKKSYGQRISYYGELCRLFQLFRRENGLTPFELDAFLYDYAIRKIASWLPKPEMPLPHPKSAYFITTDRSDCQYSEKPDAAALWPCSPEAGPGDDAILYLRAPDKAITSIWRCLSEPFRDPFSPAYYYACVAHPVKIKTVSLRWMQKDALFRQDPLVRGNMQYAGGVSLPPELFHHLLAMTGTEFPGLDG
jgi:hypothetical protein